MQSTSFIYDIDAINPQYANTVEIKERCLMQKADITSQAKLLLSSNSELRAVRLLGDGGWSEVLSFDGIIFRAVY